MSGVDKQEVDRAVRQLLADFPGQENEPSLLEDAARLVESGKDPEVEGRELQLAVGRALRKRAMASRSRGL